MSGGQPNLLLGLAPDGVFPADDVATIAVGSYPPFHPYRGCGGIFSVALSVALPLRMLSGVMSCGARTFLLGIPKRDHLAYLVKNL